MTETGDVGTDETATGGEAPADTGEELIPDLVARLVTFPSQQIRPVPPFVFAVPRGWVLEDAPHALAVVRTPQEVDDFWPNLMLSHQRVSRSLTIEDAANESWARLVAQNPDAEIDMQKVVQFGGLPMYLRGCTMAAPEADGDRKIAQLHALFFAPAGAEQRTQDFFQFTGTCPDDTTSMAAGVFTETIASFRFI